MHIFWLQVYFPRNATTVSFNTIAKPHTQMQWLHIMEEILPETKLLFDFIGTQYMWCVARFGTICTI